jgi:hypothetical protein
MGQHHVPLTINQDGLVTSVGNNEIYETCVICGEKTDVKITTHIDYRYGYVEGSGQCCKECYDRTNNIERTMKHRTSHIMLSGEEILNKPNDSELGAFVRERYWNTFNIK